MLSSHWYQGYKAARDKEAQRGTGTMPGSQRRSVPSQDKLPRLLTHFTQPFAPSVDFLTWNVTRLIFLPGLSLRKEESNSDWQTGLVRKV